MLGAQDASDAVWLQDQLDVAVTGSAPDIIASMMAPGAPGRIGDDPDATPYFSHGPASSHDRSRPART